MLRKVNIEYKSEYQSIGVGYCKYKQARTKANNPGQEDASGGGVYCHEWDDLKQQNKAPESKNTPIGSTSFPDLRGMNLGTL